MPKNSLFAPLPIRAGLLFLEHRLGRVGAAIHEIWVELMSGIKALMWTTFVLALIATPFFLYTSASENGYVPHTVETSISAQQNWLVGEVKDCESGPLDTETAHLLGKEPGYVASAIVCDAGPEHRMKVTLYGELNQPGRKAISWRCTRDSDGFTCKQTGAE